MALRLDHDPSKNGAGVAPQREVNRLGDRVIENKNVTHRELSQVGDRENRAARKGNELKSKMPHGLAQRLKWGARPTGSGGTAFA